jgi:membrane protein implicated in regulation of membrane protease activity
MAGVVLLAATLVAQGLALISPVTFMVLIGLSLYLPYVAIHTTVFERFFAVTRERGNVGYLLYVADALGYLGYVAVLCLRLFGTGGAGSLAFFIPLCWCAVAVLMVSLVWAMAYFVFRTRADAPSNGDMTAIDGDSVETTSP